MKKGFVVILASILVLTAGLVIVSSASYISFNNIRAVRNNIYSVQAYYLAEAGIEDSLLRLSKGMNFSQSNNLTIGDGTATIEISDPIGGSRTIISQGDALSRFRKIRTIYTVATDDVSFYYGAQVGDGGMVMENNSRIKGNVFSNGDIVSTGHNYKGYIDNTVKVAATSKIKGLVIGENAYSYSCENCDIDETFYYSGGSLNDCDADEIKDWPVQEPKDLPISEEQITKWKDDALSGGTLFGDYTIKKKIADYLGPKKIEGNLTLENGSILIITGTLWITGNVIINNGALIRLDRGVYGATSGILIADGRIDIQNGAEIQGSGQEGSYTMLLSTDPSLYLGLPAINVNNNALGAILYASKGLIRLRNSMEIREATGYKIYLDNNAVIEYELGLEDTNFSSGPGASWKVTEWKEIE